MALFVLGDPHLSLGASKPMDIFPGWNDYVERLEKNWRKLIKPEDTIVLAGDISWAMRLTDTRKDFEFLQMRRAEGVDIHDAVYELACRNFPTEMEVLEAWKL
jgi:predicted phosphohydrolase